MPEGQIMVVEENVLPLSGAFNLYCGRQETAAALSADAQQLGGVCQDGIRVMGFIAQCAAGRTGVVSSNRRMSYGTCRQHTACQQAPQQ